MKQIFNVAMLVAGLAMTTTANAEVTHVPVLDVPHQKFATMSNFNVNDLETIESLGSVVVTFKASELSKLTVKDAMTVGKFLKKHPDVTMYMESGVCDKMCPFALAGANPDQVLLHKETGFKFYSAYAQAKADIAFAYSERVRSYVGDYIKENDRKLSFDMKRLVASVSGTVDFDDNNLMRYKLAQIAKSKQHAEYATTMSEAYAEYYNKIADAKVEIEEYISQSTVYPAGVTPIFTYSVTIRELGSFASRSPYFSATEMCSETTFTLAM